jgi:hypothetical protein
MWTRLTIPVALMCLATSVFADQGCDGDLMRQYRDSEREVTSLRPDKPGQMRVFAADGAEFTAGQVRWLQGQLRRIEWLCARGSPGDVSEAARVLSDVQALIKAHRRAS